MKLIVTVLFNYADIRGCLMVVDHCQMHLRHMTRPLFERHDPQILFFSLLPAAATSSNVRYFYIHYAMAPSEPDPSFHMLTASAHAISTPFSPTNKALGQNFHTKRDWYSVLDVSICLLCTR